MTKIETTQTKAPQTNWEELGISNDFLFGKIMQDQELCKELIQIILPDLKIDHIEYPELQKSITPDMDAHGIRLDVYVKDDKDAVYDIEMQVGDTKELPKRSRYYYQGMIDLQLIDKGQHYKRLNQSYIIFICPFDLYGKGRHIYTFDAVKKARKNRKWRHEYMTLLMRDQENIEKGREEGIFGMISSLRDLNIPDSTILQQLQEKFLLTKEESQKYLNH